MAVTVEIGRVGREDHHRCTALYRYINPALARLVFWARQDSSDELVIMLFQELQIGGEDRAFLFRSPSVIDLMSATAPAAIVLDALIEEVESATASQWTTFGDNGPDHEDIATLKDALHKLATDDLAMAKEPASE